MVQLRNTIARAVPASALALVFVAASAHAQDTAGNGATIFQRECASCHAVPAADSRAPNPTALRQFAPEAIVSTLTTGTMRVQGGRLSEDDRRAVAQFLTGRAPAAASLVAAGRCAVAPAALNPAYGPRWNGWGAGDNNTRYQPADRAGLTAADLPKLTLKWAFGFPEVLAARMQPTIVGGRLFTGSEKGDVFALDAKTGCTYWTFRAQAGVRGAMTVGPYTVRGVRHYAVYFGDGKANAYAVDADSGQQVWMRKVEEHANAAITGPATVFGGRVYVPTAGVGEEGQGGRTNYACCTFRGSISALDATTGAVVWKSYTIQEEPKPRGANKDGVQTMGPAGGGVWAAPTVDARRGVIYVATGNNYADPPQRTTDAVVALDLKTGKVRWVNQVTPNDVWTLGCPPESKADNPNCPAKMGPDHDFSASPILARTARGRELLVLPQKSGMAYALDPDREGALVWQYRIGEGSGLGGQWGAAVDGQQAYFGVSDFLTKNPGGMHAVNLETGARVWFTPPQAKLCGVIQQCNAAQGAAVTAIAGAVLASSADGGLRAYAAKDGAIVWQFDTNRQFSTVNGVKANGGSMDGPGPVVVGGMVYVNSGYGGFVGRAGNVLLAFGID